MDISEAEFVVIDVETTGLDPATDTVVEIAAVRYQPRDGVIGPVWQTLVNPERSIPATASAIHGITDAMVAHAPIPDEAWLEFHRFVGDDAVLVAHHATFDRSFLPVAYAERAWLCTMRLAKHLWPEAPTHSNQGLRYQLGFKAPATVAHRAADDALVTTYLLDEALGEYSWTEPRGADRTLDTLLAYAASPIKVTTMPFGKHQGKPLAEIPADYIRWLLNQPDVDPDLRASLLAI